MVPFASFKFPSRTQTRRQKMLSEVMPVGDDFTYFVLLSDAYLTSVESERHIQNFDDLKNALGHADDLKALQVARTNGQLTEGRHALPAAVAVYLANAGGDPPHVRRWVLGDTKPIITTVALSEIKDAWAYLAFEEVEVGDPSGRWYFCAKDDDPLTFLAVKSAALSDDIRRCKEFCLEVTGDFLYAR